MNASLRQPVFFFACEYGNRFLPSELTESSRHSQDRYSQPMWRPFSFRHLHPVMKSSDTCWTPSLRTLSVTNWKSRGGDVSSIVLTTDISSSTERFSIKTRRRSLGDGCGGGTMTAGTDLRMEISGFDKYEGGAFSFVLGNLIMKTVKIVNYCFQTEVVIANLGNSTQLRTIKSKGGNYQVLKKFSWQGLAA